MSRSLFRNLAWALVVLSVLLAGVGGLTDIAETGRITKTHAWRDSTYLVLVAIFLLLATK